MQIKLIATDLDGTLMSPDHMTITDFTLETLKKAHDKGVKIAISTGRPLSLTDSVIKQIPFADYIIYGNGSCIFDLKKKMKIYSDLISNNDAVKIIEYLLSKELFFEIYIDGKSHYQLGCEKYFSNTDMPDEFIDEVIKSLNGHSSLIEYLGNKDIEKITLYSVKDSEYQIFKSRLDDMGFSTASSFKGNLEATSKTADKGSALKALSELLHITADEIMSFGDEGNDIPMLSFAKYSFAMGNASDDCKKAARFTAKSNADDGLAAAVCEYVLNM